MKPDHSDKSSPGTATGPDAPWTVLSLLDWSARYLKERNFDEARLNVELLLSSVLGLKRIDLYLNFDRPLGMDELARYKALFQRRLQHEPLQYILGEAEFMGLKFFVDKSVLIPRPETELLVEKVLETISTYGTERMEILDIGTGSGNISVALAHFAQNSFVTATDISAAALRTAARNVTRHGISSVTLLEADVFSDFLPDRRFDVVVSNPPYISQSEFEKLVPEIKDYEPRVATCDDGDGFRFIKRVCTVAGERLRDGGTLFMEMAYNQAGETQAIAKAGGFTRVEVFDDYAGIPRVLKASVPKGGVREG